MAEWPALQAFLAEPRVGVRYVMAPFIQEGALRFLLERTEAETVIVTRWLPEDLRSGVSDLGVFDAAEEYGWTLMIHPRIHLKAYSWGLADGYIGSANLTNRALGLQEPSNEELLMGPLNLPLQRRLQLQRILHEAYVVTPAMHAKAKEWVAEQPKPAPATGLDLDVQDRRFLVSALPMSETPSRMLEILQSLDSSDGDEDPHDLACAIHDASNFRLDRLGERIAAVNTDMLRDAFFEAPFVDAIERQLQPCLQFGELKAWVHNNCHDVPVPSRRDLTGNVQTLLRWFEELDGDTYRVDVPGSRSQRLCNLHRMKPA